ncbi:hypothetical protein BV25DRAFT_400159 [Artomyces pyxidatus]|uniref:Uncharacterized protein n=1 Tax=Artomyces pyxidatus TaxID=48021 RepID=A0ACB8T669_9AGAM|nr:hypothetical protein BV25DRAFT_400159 [Artomyces pyxidatus]
MIFSLLHRISFSTLRVAHPPPESNATSKADTVLSKGEDGSLTTETPKRADETDEPLLTVDILNAKPQENPAPSQRTSSEASRAMLGGAGGVGDESQTASTKRKASAIEEPEEDATLVEASLDRPSKQPKLANTPQTFPAHSSLRVLQRKKSRSRVVVIRSSPGAGSEALSTRNTPFARRPLIIIIPPTATPIASPSTGAEADIPWTSRDAKISNTSLVGPSPATATCSAPKNVGNEVEAVEVGCRRGSE